MNKTTLQTMWLQAAKNDTLLTPKHDPTGLSMPWKSYRTVLAPEMAQNLEGFISSGEFKATYYQNTAETNTPDYYAVESTTSQFSIPASGVPKLSLMPDAPKDRLIFVSGEAQGWHCFGESNARIQQRAADGTLVFVEAVV